MALKPALQHRLSISWHSAKRRPEFEEFEITFPEASCKRLAAQLVAAPTTLNAATVRVAGQAVVAARAIVAAAVVGIVGPILK